MVGHSGRSSLCSGQARHLCPILSHHRLLFLATPAFDLSFAGERLLASRKRLGKDELYGPSRGSVARHPAFFMLCDSLLEVFGVRRIISAVRAPENVNPKAHWLSFFLIGTSVIFFSPSFDRLRTNGKGEGTVLAKSFLRQAQDERRTGDSDRWVWVRAGRDTAAQSFVSFLWYLSISPTVNSSKHTVPTK